FTNPDNLAHRGSQFSYPNYWEGAGEAVDGQAASVWMPDETDPNEGRKPTFPCWWAVRFDEETSVSEAAILWTAGKPAKDFEVQSWDGQAWKTIKATTGNSEARSKIKLDQPAKTKAVRIWITAPVAETT